MMRARLRRPRRPRTARRQTGRLRARRGLPCAGTGPRGATVSRWRVTLGRVESRRGVRTGPPPWSALDADELERTTTQVDDVAGLDRGTVRHAKETGERLLPGFKDAQVDARLDARGGNEGNGVRRTAEPRSRPRQASAGDAKPRPGRGRRGLRVRARCRRRRGCHLALAGGQAGIEAFLVDDGEGGVRELTNDEQTDGVGAHIEDGDHRRWHPQRSSGAARTKRQREPRSRGSSTSRRASPSMLKPKTARKIAMPGASAR